MKSDDTSCLFTVGEVLKATKAAGMNLCFFEKPSVEWLLPWSGIKDLDWFLLYGVTQFKPKMVFFNVLELCSAMFAFTEATIQLIICFHFSTFPYALREREVGPPTIYFFFSLIKGRKLLTIFVLDYGKPTTSVMSSGWTYIV